MHPLFLLIPLVSAFIGWSVNAILIRFLFYPILPFRIAGITLQGILPRLQPLIAEKMGKFAGTEFVSSGIIEQKITSPEILERVMPVIETHMDEFLRVKLGNELPVISMFIGDKTIDSVKKVFMKELRSMFPVVMKSYAENLKSGIDVEKIVREKIATFPPAELRQIVYRHMSRELQQIKRIGALTGLLIGLMQVLLTFVLF